MLDLKQLTADQRLAYLEAKLAILELRIDEMMEYLRELAKQARASE